MSRDDERASNGIHIPLTDDDWSKVADLFADEMRRKGGRPKTHPRLILNAILWVNTRNENWNHLPATFPPIQTCYIKSLQWRKSGLLAKAFDALGVEMKVAKR